MMDSTLNIGAQMTGFNLLNSKFDNIKANIEEVKSNSNLTPQEKKKIEQVSRSFESMFVNMMLKQMKESMLDEDEDKEEGTMTFGADTLKGYSDMLFSDYVSKSGKGIGLGEMIYKHLTGDDDFNNITQDLQITLKNNLDLNNKNNIIERKEQSSKVNDTIQGISSKVMERIGKYEDIINEASEKYGVPSSLIKSIISAESAGVVNAKSSAGAKGLMQLMDATAKDLGVKDSFNPRENIFGGAKYISMMLSKFDNNLEKALAAYNAGPGNVEKYNGIPPFKETQNYISRVKHYLTKINNENSKSV